MVHTTDGLRPIEEVEAGDFVLSRDEKTGEVALRKVLRTFITADQPVLELDLEDDDGNTGTLKVTGEHPFWVNIEKKRGQANYS